MRHLLFFVYPRAGSCWRVHFDRLAQYRNAWDGRAVVVAAFDQTTERGTELSDAALKIGAELVAVENDHVLGEAAHFKASLDLFKEESGSIFYAHGKGVTHTWYLENAVAWADGMYLLNLREPRMIDRILQQYKAVGAFRKVGWHGNAPWHFSGSFFWVDLASALAANTDASKLDRYGTEGFPGRAVPLEKSFCLTPEDHPWTNLYQQKLSMAYCERQLNNLRTRFA